VNTYILHTHATVTVIVGDFVIANWTDLHFVDPGIKVNTQTYPCPTDFCQLFVKCLKNFCLHKIS